MPKGMVKWYDRKKGYGFIQAEDGEDIFVHMSSIKCDGLKSLYEGEKVTFELGIGKKGPAAVSVQVAGDRNRARRGLNQNISDMTFDVSGSPRD